MSRIVGSRVTDRLTKRECEVIRWEPLGSGLTDTLVRFDDGSECWLASRELTGMPSRRGAVCAANAETTRALRAILKQHIAAFHEAWPGCECGKVSIGNAIVAAIEAAEEESR